MKPILVSVAKKTGYVFAVIVILAAILVIVSRVMTPYLDARRPEMEKLASDLLQAPVTIEKASVSWFQYQPGVALQNVSVLDKDSSGPVLQLRTVKVFFSIPKSIWHFKPVMSGVLISGADIVVHQTSTGEFVVQGFPAIGGYDKEPFKDESKIKDILGWLTSQQLIILRDIDVRFTGSTGQKRFLTLYNLRLENSGSEHVILGKAILHQDISTELAVAARWEGSEPDLNKINGKIYFNVSGMSIAQWFEGLTWKGWQIKKGLVSAKIWATWRDGGIKRVQTSFQLLNLDLFSSTDQSIRRINRLSGDVGWKQEGHDQIIAGDDILVDWSSKLWPATSFYLKLTPDENQKLVPLIANIGYLNIAEMRAILASSPKFLPADIASTISSVNLDGALENVSITFSGQADDLKPLLVQGHFSGVGMQAYRQIPAIENLSGAFIWKDAEGSLTLQGRKTVFNQKEIFDQPILLDQLTGDVLWQRDTNDNWKIVFKSLSVLNQDLALNVDGDLVVSPKTAPMANLGANFTLHNAAHVTKYLPVKIFSKELGQWLRGAFLAGDAQSGSLILRGPLPEFPFDGTNGNFMVAAAVNNVRLHYAPEWPDLKNISGKVQFSGRQILIDVDHAQIGGIDIGETHAEIPYLGDKKSPVLTVVSAPIRTDFVPAMTFVHKSPLEKSLGKMFKNVALSGPIAVTISLTIPLDEPDDTTLKGVIDLFGNKLQLTPWKLDVTQLTGSLNFTERLIHAAAIKGELFGKPLRLDLQTLDPTDAHPTVRATITNNIDLMDLEKWLKVPFSTVAKGVTNATTQIDLAMDKPIVIHVASDLSGVSLDLPEQYAKNADEIRQLKADIIVDEDQPLKLKVNYAELLNAALVLNRSKNSFDLTGADLRLGSGDPAWPQGKGLYITGALKELNTDKVKKYIDMSNSKNNSKLPLRSIDLTVGNLSLGSIDLTQCKIQVSPLPQGWSITLASPELAGKMTVPAEFNSSATLVVDLDKLNLNSLSSNKSSPLSVEPKSLPSIEFSARSITYGDAELRNVEINTTRSANGMAIQSLSIQSTDMNLKASGDWVQSGRGNSTRLHGKASSKNVSSFLSQLGFNVHNFVSSNGSLDFDLNWSDAPYALSLAGMSGTASLNMGKGRIVEVSQASDAKMDLGRMLNLFSLQSIPRRLSLDFSDVTMKGYSFDSLKGDFKFSKGAVITNNMRFDGPIARVEIRGKIGLAQKDFDLILSVTPYVTSSIPVAATLLTGQPVIGLAAWAVNNVIGGQVSKVATYYYNVSGSWTNPTWSAAPRS